MMTDITEVAATGVGEESKADESDTKKERIKCVNIGYDFNVFENCDTSSSFISPSYFSLVKER